MKTYLATFYTDAEYAERLIKGNSPQQALQQARSLAADPSWVPDFQSYDNRHPINHIEIRSSNMTTVAEWQEDELRLRLAARDLLDAALLARRELREFHAEDSDSEALLCLSSAIAKAAPLRA